MGASALRDAFNLVASPTFNCARATLSYVKAHDVESQVLTFVGSAADGAPFEIRSEPLRAGADENAAAGTTAQQLLDRGKP